VAEGGPEVTHEARRAARNERTQNIEQRTLNNNEVGAVEEAVGFMMRMSFCGLSGESRQFRGGSYMG
jgi:hypothetical protein